MKPRQLLASLLLLALPVVAGAGQATATFTIQVGHTVILTWDASASPGVVGYYVYRGNLSGGPYTKTTAQSVNALDYYDIGIQSGKTYYYVVTAIDASTVESAYSKEISATVPIP